MTDDVLEHSRRKFFYFGAAALFASVTPTHAMAQSVSNKLKIGVIGSGHIGGTIGGLWVKAGHSVLFSSRHPEEQGDERKRHRCDDAIVTSRALTWCVHSTR